VILILKIICFRLSDFPHFSLVPLFWRYYCLVFRFCFRCFRFGRPSDPIRRPKRSDRIYTIRPGL
jgi:hypothetical protein